MKSWGQVTCNVSLPVGSGFSFFLKECLLGRLPNFLCTCPLCCLVWEELS